MKFIKTLTKHTLEQLNRIVESSNPDFISFAEGVYSRFEFVRFVNEDGYIGMYAVIDESDISSLIDIHVDLDVEFSFFDLTKDVLFSTFNLGVNEQSLTFTPLETKIDEMISIFYTENVNVDTILDKIIEMGSSSLSEKDLDVLK